MREVSFAEQKTEGENVKEYNKANIPLAKARLVIELDGGGHDTVQQTERDHLRTQELESMNLSVLRICNLDIDRNFHGVCEFIDRSVKSLSLSQLR